LDNQQIVNFSGVNVYQGKKLILSDVDFQVNKGEFIYLIGKTGSGKSSLLQLIYSDLPLSDGKAEVCGYDLRTIKKSQVPFLRRKLGIVFQDFQLLDDRNIEENLAFVLKATGWKGKDKIHNRILEVLEAVGLISQLKKMPHQLSGGEQQRVAIARALLNQPEVILADEPTGNLDPETSNGIIRLLLKICESGKAVVMATHNYNIIYKFPGIIVKCEEGKVIHSSNKLG
jgi:cell division transport system ATP-binding protein